MWTDRSLETSSLAIKPNKPACPAGFLHGLVVDEVTSPFDVVDKVAIPIDSIYAWDS